MGRPRAVNPRQFGFIARFAACMGLLALSFSLWERLFGTLYLYPISVSAATLLNWLGVPATLDATPLADGFCALDTGLHLFHIEFECTGIFSLFIYIGAVLVYPSSFAPKVWGILAGIPAFFAYSALRIVVLVLISHLVPAWVQFCHIYLMVLLNLGFFLFLWALWVNRWALKERIA
jgi:exosortase/archaeosortase family protein